MLQISTLFGTLFLLLICGVRDVAAQTCWLSAAGLNQNRFVWCCVDVECGWEEWGCYYTPPFGNWGVTSNYGHMQNGAQCQGWKPKDSQLQWNSCISLYPPPSPDYYNWNNYTQQRDLYTVNVHGTKGVGLSVSCPRDTNGDGTCDTGGCKDVYAYGESTNWMTLYELDPPSFPPWCGTDDLVETLYFPATTVYLSCSVGWCSAAGTAWHGPTSGLATYAQMAMVVNYGTYEDGMNCQYLRQSNPEYNCLW